MIGLLLLLAASAAVADGGAVRASVPIGSLRLNVFTAPTPPRVGPLDVSALVQRGDGSAVLDAEVTVTLRRADDVATARTAGATRAAAVNKLLYVALLELGSPGRWVVEVAVRAEGVAGSTWFEIDAEPASPAWYAFWPYLLLPAVAVGLYVANQLLKRPDRRP